MTILIVEDEALIALDVSQTFEAAGARVATAQCLAVALQLVEAPGLMLAILDQNFDDQTAHLGRTYAEIERLNAAIREMEATRAWRLHTWLRRRSS